MSLTVTQGVCVEISFEMEVSRKMVSTKKSVAFGFSLQVATTTKHTTTRPRSISHQVTKLVGANSSLKATARVTEGTYDVPWTAQAIITYMDGSTSAETTLHGK